MNKDINQPKEDIRIRMGRVDSVDVFQVKESELDTLEQGEQADIFLNFSIFLFSLAFSVLLVLGTATFEKPLFETIALIILVVGIISGSILLVLWYTGRVGIKRIIKRIRDRIPSDTLIAEKESLTPTISAANPESISPTPEG